VLANGSLFDSFSSICTELLVVVKKVSVAETTSSAELPAGKAAAPTSSHKNYRLSSVRVQELHLDSRPLSRHTYGVKVSTICLSKSSAQDYSAESSAADAHR
jgi:hypothetical protein